MHDTPARFTHVDDDSPRAPGAAGDLSFGQELLWLMDRASPGTTVWNVARAFRIRGSFDANALQQALDALAARQEALRTIFVAADDGPRALVLPPAPVPLQRVDLSALAPRAAAARAHELLRTSAETPFDLASVPLLRAMLITLGSNEYIFSLDTHHIVSDGWSKSVTLRELSALYDSFATGASAALPELPLQFGQYATAERSIAHRVSLAEDLAYWRQRLTGIDPTIRLPLDRKPAATPTYEAATAVTDLPQALVERLRDVAREHGATVYMGLFAAFATVLHRYSGQTEVVIGSPSAGRLDADTENLIGFFANTLVLRTSFAGDPTFAELLGRVRETVLDAFEHQAAPLEQLVLELQSDGSLAPAPLFGVVMTMEDTLPAELRFAGTEVEALPSVATKTKFDLTLLVREQSDGLRLTLLYRSDLFEADTAARLLAHVRTVLDGAAGDPERRVDRLRLLTADEQRQVSAWNSTGGAAEPFAPVHERIKAQAGRVPHATAVVCGERRLTYAELDAAAAAVARRLPQSGVVHGAPVGVYLERSLEAIVAMCGIMQAGAAFVPLPPDAASERLERRLGESGITVVVTTPALRSALPPQVTVVTLGDEIEKDAARERHVGVQLKQTTPDDVAYVLFTSGSTGVPKGVVVSHGNLANYTQAIQARMGVSGDQPWQFATVSSLGADLGHTAIFPALTSGGTLHLIPANIAVDAAHFAAYARAHPIDVLKITPSHLEALLAGETAAGLLPRRWLVVGGEACSWKLVSHVQSLSACRILNHYGPSETTVGATTFVVDNDAPERAWTATVPIGSPLPGVRCYVLDQNAEQLPVGVEGELSIGGAGVARGYVNRPELTAQRFLPDPFANEAGARMYRTGDRVRRLRSGALEFLGRLDDQVKIRGFRVELGEIENVLQAHELVQRCAVRFTRPPHAPARLDAYVVLRDEADDSGALPRLREWLRARLPEYMLPDALIVLDRLPLSANGKLDTAALPDPEQGAEGAAAFTQPRTPTEATVAEVIAKVLNLERVSVTANLLQLGFQSILAIRALGTLSRRLGVRIPLRSFFEGPTVGQLAAAVDAEVMRSDDRELEKALALLHGPERS
ncbi:MAG: amino acid adenylation domain-containing protein [Candidatus Eremiobacteraeota bacterium]|nr:amino acid adenylation domain-containing protein [Candidatus Eremiobacteraeota bacterium]MBC5802112.1 amino acid adenylation domain-containing protein [Candidatus Eremiobacteraeota bacterium]MBC5821266.1 amino acid adenylation domain-containing protein [Candidatus Eremiobacteraeota bacterium]